VALPRKDFMENAIQRWQELGLPALELKKPWHGYDLGFWSEQCETEAQMAVEGRHYEIGEAAKLRRVKATDENTGGVT
jgi:4-hydroxy-3-polyprenylbenzoate decarboxylase